jgi:putative Holliday junction resolvase
MIRAMTRIMGLDVGSARIGVALSDESRLVARPFHTVSRTSDKAALGDLCRIAGEQGVTRIVVGLPLALDGSEQDTSRDARSIAESLRRRTRVEIVVWDERLTTVQAERALLEAGVRRGKRREAIDRVAAALMLQSYLDSLPPARPGGEAA